MNLQQMLTDLFSKRKALNDRLRRELQKYQAKKIELGQDLEEYDQAATQIMALLTIAVQQIQGKSESEGLHECLEQLKSPRCSHGKSHQSLEQLCSMLGNLISLVVDLDAELFDVLHHELQKQIVHSRTWDHVADVRLFAYYDMVERNPALKQQHSSLSIFLDALQQEYTDFVNGRIWQRPLNLAFGEAVQRLRLSKTEWQLLKSLNKDSVESLHHKFTIEELKTEVFPAELEPCRQALVPGSRHPQTTITGPSKDCRGESNMEMVWKWVAARIRNHLVSDNNYWKSLKMWLALAGCGVSCSGQANVNAVLHVVNRPRMAADEAPCVVFACTMCTQ